MLDEAKQLECRAQVRWGKNGFAGRSYDSHEPWRAKANQVEGQGLHCGHYLLEEVPGEVAESLLGFIGKIAI